MIKACSKNMVIPGHERKSVLPVKHVLLDIVHHGANGMVLHEFRNQVPHTLVQGPHFLLERRLQIRSKDLLRFGTRIAQVNRFLATFDLCNVMLDNHRLNYWSQEGTASWPLLCH